MRAIDLIIIYFALGSPFAVYAVTGRHRPISVKRCTAISARFFFWPIVAGAYFLRWLLEDEAIAETLRRERIEELRSQIEGIAFGGHSSPELFDFRDMFERYAALTLSLDADPYSHPLLGLSGHASKLSAACIYRLERERIEFHQRRARLEFAAFIGAFHESQPRNEVLPIAIEIAELLDDRETINGLSKLPAGDEAGRITATSPAIRNAAP